MALSKKDLQLIREVLKPDFSAINEKFERVEQRFNEVDNRFDRIESRLDNVESRLTGVEYKFNTIENTLTTAFREIVNEIYDLHPSRVEFNGLETRVTAIEHKLPKHIS